MGMSKSYKRRMAATEAFGRVAGGKGRGAGAPGRPSPKEQSEEAAEKKANREAHSGSKVAMTGMNTYSPSMPSSFDRENNGRAAKQRFQSRAGSVKWARTVEDQYRREGTMQNKRPAYTSWVPDTREVDKDTGADRDLSTSRHGYVADRKATAAYMRGNGGNRPFYAAKAARKQLRPRGFTLD
ncbi:MAG: hypothetical protein RL134_2526 [Actinomycetota bacterium]|jgi:hypothetical protein